MNGLPKLQDDLTPGLREFPVLKTEALIGLPGEIVRMIEPHSEADPTALLLTLHTFFGNALGRGPYYRVEGDDHGPNLFVLLVGDTSKARKGTSAGRIRELFWHADEAWSRDHVHTGLSSGEGVIWAVRDAVDRPAKRTGRTNAASDIEDVDCGVEDKRLMVQESEFAGTLRVMQREGNILSRVLRDAWDRGDLATMTKNSPARSTGALVSLLGHITADELRRCMDRTEMANGFANRFLFTCVRRSKLLPFGGNLSADAVASMGVTVKAAVERATSIRGVTMSNPTRAAWAAAYQELSQDRAGLLGALTARQEAQTVRLAMLYALWAGLDQIEPAHLAAAMAVTEFCRDSVEYIFGDALGDPVADTIISALRFGGAQGLRRTDIVNLFSRHIASDKIARALEEISRRGIATMRKDTATGGRPAEVWIITSGTA